MVPRRRAAETFLVLSGLLACARKPPLPGDPCRASTPDVCEDSRHRFSCRAFTWHLDACMGPAGCTSGGCDQTIGAAGDSCGVAGALACSSDGAEMLRCGGSSLGVLHACRGDRRCHRDPADGNLTCDRGPGEVGDPCGDAELGRCSVDGKAVLRCSFITHRLEVERACLGPRGCFVDAGFHDAGRTYLACDVGAAEPGDPCSGRRAACSLDGEHAMVCDPKTHVFETGRACACSVSWSADDRFWRAGCAGASSCPSAPLLSVADPS